jgi:hypothetical protein
MINHTSNPLLLVIPSFVIHSSLGISSFVIYSARTSHE